MILVYEGKSGSRTFGAGIAVMAVDPARAKDPDPAAYVPDVGVAPSHRRLGLEEALMAAMAGRAKEKGLATIELISDDRDSAAKAFYGKLGFDEMGKTIVYEW
ncbi:MAG: GNAT family N-acetyltransferase [Nitrospinota bacterium]|nr:GNAT family N-acetyltransferase [Nitrospinota bacterium]